MLHAFRHDNLSGALSRAYVTDLAMHDVALARRHGHPLAVAVLDIDWFKQVNDTFGHASGDRALCALVTACQASLSLPTEAGPLRLTVSTGVEVLDHQYVDWAGLLRAADAALYQAEAAGRNRTVLARGPDTA